MAKTIGKKERVKSPTSNPYTQNYPLYEFDQSQLQISYDPPRVPDVTPQMEENQRIADKNVDLILQQREKEFQINANSDKATYDAKVDRARAKARISEFIEKNKLENIIEATSSGRELLTTSARIYNQRVFDAGVNEYYVNPPVDVYTDWLLKENIFKERHLAANYAATELAKEGANPDVVRAIRELGDKSRGYLSAYLQQYAGRFGGYKATIGQNVKVEVPDGKGGTKWITIAQARTGPEIAAAQTEIRKRFLQPLNGISIPLINKHVFPEIRRIEGLEQKNLFDKAIKADQQEDINEALTGITSSILVNNPQAFPEAYTYAIRLLESKGFEISTAKSIVNKHLGVLARLPENPLRERHLNALYNFDLIGKDGRVTGKGRQFYNEIVAAGVYNYLYQAGVTNRMSRQKAQAATTQETTDMLMIELNKDLKEDPARLDGAEWRQTLIGLIKQNPGLYEALNNRGFFSHFDGDQGVRILWLEQQLKEHGSIINPDVLKGLPPAVLAKYRDLISIPGHFRLDLVKDSKTGGTGEDMNTITLAATAAMAQQFGGDKPEDAALYDTSIKNMKNAIIRKYHSLARDPKNEGREKNNLLQEAINEVEEDLDQDRQLRKEMINYDVQQHQSPDKRDSNLEDPRPGLQGKQRWLFLYGVDEDKSLDVLDQRSTYSNRRRGQGNSRSRIRATLSDINISVMNMFNTDDIYLDPDYGIQVRIAERAMAQLHSFPSTFSQIEILGSLIGTEQDPGSIRAYYNNPMENPAPIALRIIARYLKMPTYDLARRQVLAYDNNTSKYDQQVSEAELKESQLPPQLRNILYMGDDPDSAMQAILGSMGLNQQGVSRRINPKTGLVDKPETRTHEQLVEAHREAQGWKLSTAAMPGSKDTAKTAREIIPDDPTKRIEKINEEIKRLEGKTTPDVRGSEVSPLSTTQLGPLPDLGQTERKIEELNNEKVQLQTKHKLETIAKSVLEQAVQQNLITPEDAYKYYIDVKSHDFPKSQLDVRGSEVSQLGPIPNKEIKLSDLLPSEVINLLPVKPNDIVTIEDLSNYLNEIEQMDLPFSLDLPQFQSPESTSGLSGMASPAPSTTTRNPFEIFSDTLPNPVGSILFDWSELQKSDDFTGQLRVPQLNQAAYQAGWRGDELNKIVGICKAESEGDPSARNNTDIEDSIGLCQINMSPKYLPERLELFEILGITQDNYVEALQNPITNLKAAKIIYDTYPNLGFDQWSVYDPNDSNYQKQLKYRRQATVGAFQYHVSPFNHPLFLDISLMDALGGKK